MIKCDNCGEKISLEALHCPKCNAINEIAKEHYRELAVFDKKYEKALASVREQNTEYKGFVWRVLALGIVIVFSTMVLIFKINPVDVYMDVFVVNKSYEKKLDTKKDLLLEQQEYEQYLAIYNYTRKYVSNDSTYKSFDMLVTYYHNTVYNCVKQRGDMTATYMSGFDDVYTKLEEEGMTDIQKQAAEDMKQRMSDAIIYYWDYSKEEVDALWELDDSRKHYQFELKAGETNND